MFSNWHGSDLSQLLLGFLTLEERAKKALVSKAWKREVDNKSYWNKQLQLLWPAFAARNKSDSKQCYLLLSKFLSKEMKELIKSETLTDLNFKTVFKVILEIPETYRSSFVSFIPKGEIDKFFKSDSLYRIFFQISHDVETILIKYFSPQIKKETDSGWMLHGCLGNIGNLNKKDYLALFSYEELLSFCNDTSIRNYANFPLIKNYLFLTLAVKVLDLELVNRNKNANNNNFLDRFINKISPSPTKEELLSLKNIINEIDVNTSKKLIIDKIKESAKTLPVLSKICDELEKKLNDLDGKLNTDHIFIFNNNNNNNTVSKK